jgi:hypothetical protein
LRVVFEEAFTGRAAEIEISAIVSAAMPGTGYFHLHTADRVYCAFGHSKGHVLGSGELSLLLNRNSIAAQCYGTASA